MQNPRTFKDGRGSGLTTGSEALRVLSRYPVRNAFAWDGGALSYAGTLDLIGRMQGVLTTAGLKRGQRMILLSSNRAEAWCAGMAAQLLGMASSNCHPIASLDDHLYQITDAGAAAVVIDPSVFAERGRDIAASVGSDCAVFTLGPSDFGVDLIAASEAFGTVTPKDLAQITDVATIHYTGGSTGRSKGAVRTHRTNAAYVAGSIADYEIPSGCQYLAAAPISHVAGGFVMPVLARGGTVHLQKSFDPDRILRGIETHKIGMTLLVPTMIYGLLEHPGIRDVDTSSLQTLLYGGSPMSPAKLLQGLETIGPVFTQLYGLTETFMVSNLGRQDHDPNRPELFGSCGVPSFLADIKVVDDDGQDMPVGEPGEISIRTPNAMEYYLNLPEETEKTIQDGWIRSGDVAYKDEQGYLFIVDRKKDMIVTGGFNVYPKGVEDVLTADPAVAMAAVIGVPDDKWGERVTAVIVPSAGAAPDTTTLAAAVKAKLGSVQTPKSFELVEQLPLTAVGKIDKNALRKSYWAGQGRNV